MHAEEILCVMHIVIFLLFSYAFLARSKLPGFCKCLTVSVNRRPNLPFAWENSNKSETDSYHA